MIILGLGSNLSSSFGDRFENIEIAISYLEKYEIKVTKKSSYYETPSYPNKNNPKFINIIIEAKTHLNPADLASVLIFIEEKLQRKRRKKNDPRTCDIDIIDYKNQIINFKYNNLDFIVPHRKLIYRNFVLFPLQEILPAWKHPETNDNISFLIERLSDEDKKSILKISKS
jgi:2-amino-4-hydroxy-6-hydroxymethyldihydropteridine diphosphokinase|tara:strand:+ start:151 stop:663 length:513 start_codon:yes stop_codon:yes gene_type:complete